MEPHALSEYLREGDDAELQRRRWLVGLSMVGMGAGQVVSMYQTGIIGHLPDPPPHAEDGGIWDSDRVDASSYAYKRYDTPDGLIMTASYAVTALLAGAGGPNRARNHPWLSIATAAKALYDTAVAVELGREEWQENKALCAYCQTATFASAATLALALPDAVRAVRHLMGGASDA